MLALLACVPAIFGQYRVGLATEILIFAVLAMAIDILAGFAGRTSLGHGAIFGASTYVALYFVNVAGGAPHVGLLLGILAATLLALVFGLLAIRTSGVYFLLLTLALGMIVWGICLRWTSVTGGENGIRGNIRPEWLRNHVTFYYVVLGVTAVLAYVMWRFVRSPFGESLKGIRESESRMRSLGYNVPLHLLIGFVVSGVFAGVAGGLYGLYNSFVSPTTVSLAQSVSALLMVIVGGVGTLFGSLHRLGGDHVAAKHRKPVHGALADGARRPVHRNDDPRPGGHHRQDRAHAGQAAVVPSSTFQEPRWIAELSSVPRRQA